MYACKENYAHKHVIRYKIGSLLLYTLYWYAYLHVCTIYTYSMPANTNYAYKHAIKLSVKYIGLSLFLSTYSEKLTITHVSHTYTCNTCT